MDKEKIIDFFDSLASSWDEHQERREDVIKTILDIAEVRAGCNVLDVACGTGILIGDYLDRKAASVTGIDISPNMIECARSKFPTVDFICDDAQCCSLDKSFDSIMIYNAFPHFSCPDKLFMNLTSHLKEGGRLTVAHGISEEELRKCHSGSAKEISTDLPCKEDMAALMAAYLKVDVMISDSEKYIVSGRKA